MILPELTFVSAPAAPEPQAQRSVVVGVHGLADALALAPTPFAAGVAADINLALLGASADTETVVRVPAADGSATTFALVGAGKDAATLDAETLRRAAGSAVRALATTPVTSITIALPITSVEQAVAAAEGALLGAYRYERYRTTSNDLADQSDQPVKARLKVSVVVPAVLQAAAQTQVDRVSIVAQAVWRARDLVNTAPNDLPPTTFAEIAKTVAKLPGTKVTVLDEKALASGGFGGHIAVGQGSINPPRLVKVAYRPSKPQASIALVGKGITFDSGGLSLKPAKSMETMKSDMAGAATVLQTVVAAAQLKLPVAVTAWLCLAENMPSGTATRPSDVIEIHGGRTVEVLNTDAEGRLVLADGLAAAIEEKPDVVIDIATLTGAQIVALGHRVAGVMGTESVRERVLTASASTGEQFWPMPLPAELRKSFDSKIADMANIGSRQGGMLVAGLFLKEFVGDTPWAHLDVAGPAFNEFEPYGGVPSGGTGFGLRTLLALVEGFAQAEK